MKIKIIHGQSRLISIMNNCFALRPDKPAIKHDYKRECRQISAEHLHLDVLAMNALQSSAKEPRKKKKKKKERDPC